MNKSQVRKEFIKWFAPAIKGKTMRISADKYQELLGVMFGSVDVYFWQGGFDYHQDLLEEFGLDERTVVDKGVALKYGTDQGYYTHIEIKKAA